MILYFSGTGNSRYTAREIAGITGERLVCINDIMRDGMNVRLSSHSPFVFVLPTYAWRMPRVAEEFIRKAGFAGTKDAYFILTCGSETGNAWKYAKRLCDKKGLKFLGLKGIKMPENYIVMFSAPGKDESKKIIGGALPDMVEAAERIKTGRPFEKPKLSFVDRIKSSLVNIMFYPLFVKADGFFAKESCVSCGLCEKICPLKNITLLSGRPVWGDSCTHCMACICACPEGAIEYSKKTKGKRRYYLD